MTTHTLTEQHADPRGDIGSEDVAPRCLVSRSYAATYLGVHLNTIDALRKRGYLRSVMVGGCVRLPLSELERIAEQGTERVTR